MGVTLALALSLAPPDPLDDLARFVGHDCAAAGYDASWRHLAWLEAQRASRPAWLQAEWGPWLDDARACRDAWQFLSAAGDPQVYCVSNGESGETTEWYDDPAYRRGRLQALRELVGEADYFAGRMPPPVPVWRFRRP